MIKVIVTGAMGRMGSTACGAVEAKSGMVLAGAVDSAFADESAKAAFGFGDVPIFTGIHECLAETEADVAVDFTLPASVFDNVLACLDRNVHCVVGTTGLSEDQLSTIALRAGANNSKCFIAPNFAIGAVLLMEACRQIVKYLPAVEIIELHHDKKLDAPSGTALRTADLIAAERGAQGPPPGPEGHAARGFIRKGIPIHSVRLPGLVAHQEVVFGGAGQTLSLRHDSISRESFMPGVLLAVRKVSGLKEPLTIGLENLL